MTAMRYLWCLQETAQASAIPGMCSG